jgi:hypothetical protein
LIVLGKLKGVVSKFMAALVVVVVPTFAVISDIFSTGTTGIKKALLTEAE